MSDQVWMTVTSKCWQGVDDQKVNIVYSPAVDMVVIEVGSGSMYIPVSMAAAMMRNFSIAVETALRAQVPAPSDERVA